jgi:hypothetical protein
MRCNTLYFLLATLTWLALPASLFAWGPEGHRVIGRAAFELLDPTARDRVMALLAVDTPDAAAQALDEACNWPDTVRETPEWSWSAPLHYVNLPRGSRDYDRERDCPEGRCVTEGILKYASALSRPVDDSTRNWQSLAFLCHLVGDIHQPLHAGFRDDRGANEVDVVYRGEHYNLHEFWDSVLVRERLQDESARVAALVEAGRAVATQPWNPSDVGRWTEESHGITVDAGYPPDGVIDAPFVETAWALIERQWILAAGRLARILNAVLGDGDVAVERQPSTAGE